MKPKKRTYCTCCSLYSYHQNRDTKKGKWGPVRKCGDEPKKNANQVEDDCPLDIILTAENSVKVDAILVRL